jgi:hypothetical protein
VKATIDKFLNINGTKSVDRYLAFRFVLLMWNNKVGMARNEKR